MLLYIGYSSEPRPNSHVLAIAGSIMTVSLLINRCSCSKRPVWREKTWLTSPEVWAVATSMAWFNSGRASFSRSPSKRQKETAHRVALSSLAHLIMPHWSRQRQKEEQPQVILLQIVMVSPGTRLLKKYKSLSRTIESQFKKQGVAGSFVTTQLIWRQTPKFFISVYWKKKYSPSIVLAQQRLKEISVV